MTKGTRAADTRQRAAVLRLAFVAIAIMASGTTALAQQAAAGSGSRLTFAINEGGAANADYAETMFRFQEFGELVKTTLKTNIAVVTARDPARLRENLKNHAYDLLLARPNDTAAEAIRDHGYQLIAIAKEPSQAWFVVSKNSTLKTITEVRGKSIVTPDRYTNMWRVAKAMLRDNHIDMNRENVKAMRDQAAVGWSVENGFFDVGVLNSVSGAARKWEKNGGRVIARSPELPNMPFIASPSLSSAQVARLRAAVVSLDSTEQGRAILKKIGLTGFKETPAKTLLDYLAWIGDLDKEP